MDQNKGERREGEIGQISNMVGLEKPNLLKHTQTNSLAVLLSWNSSTMMEVAIKSDYFDTAVSLG